MEVLLSASVTDPVWGLNVFIGGGLLFVIGIIALIIIEATNE